MTGPTFKTQFGRIVPPRQDWLDGTDSYFHDKK